MSRYNDLTKQQLIDGAYSMMRDVNQPDVLKEAYLRDRTIQIWSENLVTTPRSKIFGNKYMSENAYQQIVRTGSKKGLVHEHITTKQLVYKKHFGTHFLEVEKDEIRGWLESCAVGCVVTKEEDRQLLGGSLRSDMPEEFYEPGNEWFLGKWSRYLKAGLTDIWVVEWDGKVPRKVSRPDFSEIV